MFIDFRSIISGKFCIEYFDEQKFLTDIMNMSEFVFHSFHALCSAACDCESFLADTLNSVKKNLFVVLESERENFHSKEIVHQNKRRT